MYILDHQNLNGFIKHTRHLYITEEIKKVIERTNYILNALSPECTQQVPTE